MLQIYPETLLEFAVDDVIHATSIGVAIDAQRLASFARARATQEYDHAAQEAQALRAAAVSEGYRDGLQYALHGMAPLLMDLRQQQVTLFQAVTTHVHDQLRALGTAPDGAVEQICAAFLQRLSVMPQGERAVLHLPADQDALWDALAGDPRLAELELQRTPRATPLLEIGQLAWELDPAGVLAEDLDAAFAVQMPELQAALSRLADDYAAHLLQTLQQAAGKQKFSTVGVSP